VLNNIESISRMRSGKNDGSLGVTARLWITLPVVVSTNLDLLDLLCSSARAEDYSII
jgi:hypothetical protein